MLNEEAREKARKVLDEEIRPRLQADGGDVELVELTDDGVARVRLTGSCSGCPFSAMTLAVTVEQTLKQQVPGITRVEPTP